MATVKVFSYSRKETFTDGANLSRLARFSDGLLVSLLEMEPVYDERDKRDDQNKNPLHGERS